ncbi:SPOR domain-containing protein [Rhodanobacter sp. DHG33]|uniref:SPOR domain-containing protein n=1 Tax=Rhodanobacter sp. DHG33 TaxID=2775921 RepID=UPI00178442A9|nr:SPOR domain-containing protein [Rhodanobacter sp. DHG33]MBD8898192.1 SPOR domain-containing protein [Rhodanobacter sp. DHG33]
MKTRLLGAAVLIALLVIFVPMFFSSNPSPATAAGGDQSVSLAIPPAQDNNLQTRTMSLTPGAPAGSGSAVAPARAASAPSAAATASTQAPASSGQLAAVNIPSNRPKDVGTDAAAPKAQQNGPTMGSGASPAQPVIPLQGGSSGVSTTAVAAGAVAAGAVAAAATHGSSQPQAPAATMPAASPAATAGATGRSLYVLNLSAYANANSVDRLVRRVRGFGYPVLTRVITQAGKQLTLVTAGPFDSRTSAEAARLKITQSIPGVPAKLVEGLGHADSNIASTPVATAPAAGAPAPAAAAAQGAGGWSVQLAAMGNQGDANALRDKLRADGFDGYVDTVNANGKQLWRVRAGPQTQRADAERVRDQINAKFGISGNVVRVP